MNIVYLILAHNNPQLLYGLVKKLNDKDVDFYIHIDKKSTDNFDKLKDFSNVHLVENRMDVRWGDISMIETLLMCCKKIISESGENTYIVLLSGLDYPVKGNKYIKNYFENNRYNFINGVKIPSEECCWQENGRRRLACYSLRLKARKMASIEPQVFNVSNIKQLFKVILYNPSKIFKALEIIFSYPKRKHPDYFIPYGGEFWWILPIETIKNVIGFVDKHPDFLLYHKGTNNPDEIFINTIVYNIVDNNKIKNDCLRFIKWVDSPSPQDITINDMELIRRCCQDKDILFIRKAISGDVRKLIDEMIM